MEQALLRLSEDEWEVIEADDKVNEALENPRTAAWEKELAELHG